MPDSRPGVCECGCGEATVIYRGRPNRFVSGHNTKVRRHGMSTSTVYGMLQSMVQRCHQPNHHSFANYGGRGIAVCDEWRDDLMVAWRYIKELPGCPYDDRGERTVREVSLDRIDNDRGYEPGNVRWATRLEQRRNQRLPYETLLAELRAGMARLLVERESLLHQRETSWRAA